MAVKLKQTNQPIKNVPILEIPCIAMATAEDMSDSFFTHFGKVSMPIKLGRGGGFTHSGKISMPIKLGGGRVVQWSWENFQCRGVLQFG